MPFRTISTNTITNATPGFEVDRLTAPGQIIFDPNPDTDAALRFFRTPNQDLNGFEVYFTENGSSIYLRSGSENSAVATILSDSTVAEGFNGSIIARNTSTNLPLSGTADYTGDYAAIVTADATGQRVDTVTGDVALVADFESALISGRISNREFSNGRSLVDEVLIPASTLVEGGTSGIVRPDVSDGDDLTSGGFAALIAGANANEIVGYTQLDYVVGTISVTENGGFRASR